MSRLTLAFGDEAEKEFLHRFFERSLAQMRFALALALFLYGMFGILDAIAAPAQKAQLWIIRYAIVCPLIVAIEALTYTRRFRRYSQFALGLMVLAAGIGIVAMTVIAPPPVNYLYHAGLILVLMFGFTFIRLRFVHASIVSIVIVASYLATTVIAGKTPPWVIINNAYFLVTAFIIGGFACYSIEGYERNDFLQTRELIRTNTDLIESRRVIIESSRRAQLIFSALADALPGTDLENKYRLEEKIGGGGFGTVYRARHLLLDAPVAVKIFRPVGGMNMEKSFERFRLEGMSGKRITHPNAVAVLDFGIASNAIAFLVMELLEGHTLADEMRSAGRLSSRRCAEIAVPICSVLAEAHGNGIIHRDIKPSNIFLHQTKTGEIVKVVDFGIAKLLEPSTAEDLEELTATGIVIGTPSYMAPERLASQAYGASCDVYSVGVLMYQMLTGHVPHATTLAQMTQHATPPASDRLSDIIVRALSLDPAERPTALEMARSIAAIYNLPVPVVSQTHIDRASDADSPTLERDPSTAKTVVAKKSA
ncbi:MAG TPA: serine/threonine-protein kinase [Thermoanaerobaculia bacterium]|nr:serine/threonine-protein kinase [Thermoanaerobaculia bacterium]